MEKIKYHIYGGKMPTTLKITKRTVDNAVIDSLFDFRGYTDDDKTALMRIIDDCQKNGIKYTMSTYVKKLYREGCKNDGA